MAIVWDRGPYAGSNMFEGRVLYVGEAWIERHVAYASVWTGTEVGDIVLNDWGYEDENGGWTKDAMYAKYPNNKVHFVGLAVVDATQEAIEAATEWRRISTLIQMTKVRLEDACRTRPGREVEVYKGRAVPLGTYTVTRSVYWVRSRPRVSLANSLGEMYDNVLDCNVRVVRPERYVTGTVACRGCRQEFPSAVDAGMVAETVTTPHSATCRGCRLELILDADMNVKLPEWAVNRHFSAFCTFPSLRDTEGEGFVRSLFETPDDKVTWAVFCDWLEEVGDRRHEELRIALFDRINTPIRRKDMKVSKWKMVRDEGYGWQIWECRVSGFPTTSECEEVVARTNTYMNHTAGQYRVHPDAPSLFCVKRGEEVEGTGYCRKYPTGMLLRQLRAVVNTATVPV